MIQPAPTSTRFTTQHGTRCVVQAPEIHADRITSAILETDTLRHGDYDSVTFTSTPGRQRFRSLGTGRNCATSNVVEVACIELSFFLPDDRGTLQRCLEAIYHAHPYEEPVIFVSECLRPLHIRGMDEDNANRFWNDPVADWVPSEHR